VIILIILNTYLEIAKRWFQVGLKSAFLFPCLLEV